MLPLDLFLSLKIPSSKRQKPHQATFSNQGYLATLEHILFACRDILDNA